MASRVAVAIEKEDAINRINSVLERIAKEAGEEYAPLPTQGKDADIVTKNQLVHLADALERLLSEPTVQEPDASENPPDGDRDTEDAPKTSEAADTAPGIDTLKVSKRTKGRS